MVRHLVLSVAVCLTLAGVARAQDAQPPAYLSVVEGVATVQRDGELLQATQNMPLVPGDRLRTENGRVQVMFPDGSAIELDAYSEIECLSPTRVRLIAGTMDHLQRDMTRSASASYLPQGLDVYGTTLDQYGSWQYDAPYGYVWYPTVAPDWRPYYYGYWSPVRTYGWTWVGVDSWAWPTHHYGRWGYASNRWFWIPGRTWGPAWVSWASAADYVSWCPLGFDSRPVFALNVASRNTWAGWTVLPRAHFGAHEYYAHRYAVEPRRIAATTPFIAHNTPPVPFGRTPRISNDNGRAAAAAATAVPRPSPLGSRQAPVGSTQSPVGRRQAQPVNGQPAAGQPSIDPRWSRNPQTGVQTHYGVAVPRTVPPQPSMPVVQPSAPGSQPQPPAQYRPAVPGYQAPNGYRIQRMDPRVMSPAPAPAQPNAAPPPAAGAVAVPRAMPPAGARATAPASQPAPQAAPPPQRSAPSGQPAQGQAQPRGEGQAAGTRRPR